MKLKDLLTINTDLINPIRTPCFNTIVNEQQKDYEREHGRTLREVRCSFFINYTTSFDADPSKAKYEELKAKRQLMDVVYGDIRIELIQIREDLHSRGDFESARDIDKVIDDYMEV